MKKKKKEDWLMSLIVLPFALFGSIILWIGARDIEEHRQEQEVYTDSIRTPNLKTFEDSVHEFEDGF